MMLDQKTDNTETLKQIDISVASFSKQDNITQEELEEVTGQRSPLKLVFSYFNSRLQKIQNQITKNKDKEPAEKKRKIQV